VLPEDVAVTEDEQQTIDDALAFFFGSLAISQSLMITETNQSNMIEATNIGSMEMREQAAEGNALSQQEVAVISGAFLDRKLKSRLGAIVNVNTQITSEASKLTEAEILSGQVPSVQATTSAFIPATKEWVSVGDEKVRPAHVVADGQTVEVNGVFIVGGESLRFPGDPFLGATAGNIIECRCTAVYSLEDITEIRRA
jgi:hypothetical protein